GGRRSWAGSGEGPNEEVLDPYHDASVVIRDRDIELLHRRRGARDELRVRPRIVGHRRPDLDLADGERYGDGGLLTAELRDRRALLSAVDETGVKGVPGGRAHLRQREGGDRLDVVGLDVADRLERFAEVEARGVHLAITLRLQHAPGASRTRGRD